MLVSVAARAVMGLAAMPDTLPRGPILRTTSAMSFSAAELVFANWFIRSRTDRVSWALSFRADLKPPMELAASSADMPKATLICEAIRVNSFSSFASEMPSWPPAAMMAAISLWDMGMVLPRSRTASSISWYLAVSLPSASLVPSTVLATSAMAASKSTASLSGVPRAMAGATMPVRPAMAAPALSLWDWMLSLSFSASAARLCAAATSRSLPASFPSDAAYSSDLARALAYSAVSLATSGVSCL